MGIGEPLDNFDNVMKFLKLVNHPQSLNIGMRHISLSTCGLTEKFDKLAALNLQLTLSVSLHAPDDETRSRVIFERFCRRLQADADARHAVNQWEILRAEMIHRRRLAQRRTSRACNRVDQIVRFFHVAALIDADINLIIPALFLCMRGKRF